jgi:HAD superfamily hydrolase (TIGR01450 family)
VLLDLDGTVWVGDAPCPGAPEALTALREGGIGVRFVTNDSRHSAEELVRKLWRLGFRAAVGEVITVGYAVQRVLAEQREGGSAYVIGSRALVEHVAAAGLRIVNRTTFAPRADVVVVGGHDGLAYDELRVAAQAVRRGAQLVGASRDATFPMPDGPWPGTGAVLAAIEVAGGRRADIVAGMPEPPMYEAACADLGPGRVLAIGDRAEVDVAGALAAGLDAALVGGIGDALVSEADEAGPKPTLAAPSLAALVTI